MRFKVNHADQPIIISTYIEYKPEIAYIVARPENFLQLIEIITVSFGYFLIPIIQWNYSSRML
jgi:hypothetical protein